jgi:hypothetical protein
MQLLRRDGSFSSTGWGMSTVYADDSTTGISLIARGIETSAAGGNECRSEESAFTHRPI